MSDRPPLRRLSDWQPRFEAYWRARDRYGARPGMPFAWGQHDCALFALGAIDAMCGTEHAAAIRGQYTDRDEAMAYCLSRGWKDLGDAAREYLGEPIPWSKVRRGDVLHLPSDEFRGGLLAVSTNAPTSHVVAAPAHSGLVWFTPWRVHAAFAVGRP